MGILGWPVSSKDYIDYLQTLMDDTETYGGEDAIARIEALILDYETASAALVTLTVSTQASMTKADVVEWDPKLTMGAAKTRVNSIVSRIRAALGVAPDPFVIDEYCETRPLRLRRG